MTILNEDGSLNHEKLRNAADELNKSRKLKDAIEASLKVANFNNICLFSSSKHISTWHLHNHIRKKYEYLSDLECDEEVYALYSYLYEKNDTPWSDIDRPTLIAVMTAAATHFTNIGFDATHMVFYSTLNGRSDLLDSYKASTKSVEDDSVEDEESDNFFKILLRRTRSAIRILRNKLLKK